jgi:hypothetical protein
MSVQTRSQLVASAATITTETAAGANTAARVGGLFDDLADTATLDRERGVVNRYITTPTNWTPTQGSAVKLTAAMTSGVVSTYNFSSTTTSLTYTGTTSAILRVSLNIVLAQVNNVQVKIYIAKNGTPIDQSLADLHFRGTEPHSVFTETVLQGTANDEFTIYINAVNSGNAITISALTFTAHTL